MVIGSTAVESTIRDEILGARGDSAALLELAARPSVANDPDALSAVALLLRTAGELTVRGRQTLERMCGHSARDVRTSAAASLADHPDEASVPTFLMLIDDVDSTVRRWGAIGLSRTTGVAAQRATALAAFSPDKTVRREVVDALDADHVESRAALLKLAHDADWRVRRRAKQRLRP